MGTNFYLVRDTDTPVCASCGENPTGIHVGKSSVGWVFLWHGYHAEPVFPRETQPSGVELPDLTCPTEWFAFLADRRQEGWRIENEYGERQDGEKFREFVESKRATGRRNKAAAASVDRLLVEAGGDEVAFYGFR
jgi:hypothetical protein